MPCFAPIGVGDNRNARNADLAGNGVLRVQAGDFFGHPKAVPRWPRVRPVTVRGTVPQPCRARKRIGL
jgi:hypothetical protein